MSDNQSDNAPVWRKIERRIEDEWATLSQDQGKAEREIERLRAQVAALEKKNRMLTVMTENSLVNNLCPDHRDKQKGKPCLACTVENLEKRRDALERDAERYRWLRDKDTDGFVISLSACDWDAAIDAARSKA